ncbi:MAG: hypothetical protein AB7L66_23210 [Gemmatimonadales bacterium]
MLPVPRVWAVTLWTAGRLPSLVEFGAGRIGPSLLGRLVLERWEQLAAVFPEVVVDEYAILPDRFRALVQSPVAAQIELAVAWFRAALAQESRLAGLSGTGIVWEVGVELLLLESVDEWIGWRRRIRTGRSLGLSGAPPAVSRGGFRPCGGRVEHPVGPGRPREGPTQPDRSGNGTSTVMPSRAIETAGNTAAASASSSGASRL